MRRFTLAVTVALGACSSGQRDVASRPAPTECLGERIVRVDNRLAVSADVFAHARRTRVFLGTVEGNESAEWTLPPGTSRASAEASKAPTVSTSGLYNPNLGPVRFFYSCRES